MAPVFGQHVRTSVIDIAELAIDHTTGFDRDLAISGRALVDSSANLQERLFTIPSAGACF